MQYYPNMNSEMPLVAFATLGCAKNGVDTAVMSALVSQAGYRVTEEVECADALIINTCSFIEPATEESIDAIFEALGLPNFQQGDAKLIVSGCMPARYGNELAAELPEVDAFVPCSEQAGIVEILDSLLGIERDNVDPVLAISHAPQPDPVTAYVKISDGCDRFCSYCTIPYIRGRYHSFPYERIAQDIRGHIADGKREIILIAQDTGRWGRDFDEPSSLAQLLESLAMEFPDIWLRVMYIQPEGIDDELLSVMAQHDNVCSYLDIPLQHSDSAILKSMNRTGSKQEFLDLLGRIRESVPGITLRTTLIVGFPGETEEQFEDLCDFVEEACFDYVGAFQYSREEGTRAYDLPGQIDEDDKADRLQRIRDIADAVSSAVISQRIGSCVPVLICGEEEDGQVFARAQSQAPEVDGVAYVDGGIIGQMHQAIIEDTLLYEMEGTLSDGNH